MPPIAKQRQSVRIEAEDFQHIEGFKIDVGDRKAAKRLNLKLEKIATGRIVTNFDDIYVGDGNYDAEVRYYNNANGASEIRLYIDGDQQGATYKTSGSSEGWRSFTIPDMALNIGDKITVEANGNGKEFLKLDYLQLHYKNRFSELSGN